MVSVITTVGGPSKTTAKKHVLLAIEAAILAADPSIIVKENLKLTSSTLRIRSLRLDLSRFSRILVVGGGKASGKMALELEGMLGDFMTGGSINIPDYQKFESKTSRIVFNESTHPIPSSKGVRGVENMINLIGHPSKDDLVICLVSGGASALLPLPMPGVTLADKARVTDLLLKSGADIREINTVRKHLSSIKGGRLAKLAYPATVLSLIISDVVGDRIDAVGSGMTAPDRTTFSDAKRVLVDRRVWSRAGPRIRRAIEDGIAGRIDETPKPGSRIFRRAYNIVIGSNKLSRLRAVMELRKLGYRTTALGTEVEGEARSAGTRVARMLADTVAATHAHDRPWALVAGGETVVTVKRGGLGGRNQELVLSAAIGIEGLQEVAVASVATDGVDGPTNAAGAIADGDTVERGLEAGCDARVFLRNNDSYNYFRRLGDLVVTGPTGTNVNDIIIAVERHPVSRK